MIENPRGVGEWIVYALEHAVLVARVREKFDAMLDEEVRKVLPGWGASPTQETLNSADLLRVTMDRTLGR